MTTTPTLEEVEERDNYTKLGEFHRRAYYLNEGADLVEIFNVVTDENLGFLSVSELEEIHEKTRDMV